MKSVKLRIIIYIAVFIATVVLTYIFAIGRAGHENNSDTMSEAGLPVVYMTTDSGIKYNYLHGYTCEVDQTLIHDAITPISSDRTMSINILQYGSTISGISFTLRSVDGQELIERSEVSDYAGENGIVTADIQFRNLIENQTEYMLSLTVNTEEHGPASFYTRVIIMDDANVEQKLTYVNNFSDYVMDKDTLENITAKLETDSTGDNTNLGRVNIHSKLSQVGYGALDPELISDRYFTINEIDSNKASVTVNYKSRTSDDDGTYDYNVKEFFRINQPDDKVTYVYNYDRWMNQIFEPESSLSSNGDIYLGIRSDSDVVMKKSPGSYFTVFVQDNTLWSFSASKNRFTKVFSFEQEDSDGLREEYNAHEIKILSVDDNGNINYLVYGYMNRGIHEGELGISVCKYSSADNKSEEVIFIPRTEPYEVISQDVNVLSYINDTEILYIYSGNAVYYLDCSTKEYMVVADKIIEDTCQMSEENGIFMYQTGNNSYDNTKLEILRLGSGEIYTIDAKEDECIMSLGFIDGNIVYGEAKSSMIKVDEDGNVVFPMYKITLMDDEYNVVRDYSVKNVYITQVSFDDTKILLKRVKISKDGAVSAISDDQLLSNVEENSHVLKVTTRATESRQKEIYITPVINGSGIAKLQTASYSYSQDAVVNISDVSSNDEKEYYAYGFGCLYKVCNNIADAMSAAAESGGVVVDPEVGIIWTRYKASKYTIELPAFNSDGLSSQVAATDLLLKIAGVNESSSKLYSEGYSTLECVKELAGNEANLTGSTLEEALFFISKGCPIIARTGRTDYELIYAYNDNFVYTYDFVTQSKKEYSKKNFSEILSEYGQVLISYTK